jgi:hypothetical protein
VRVDRDSSGCLPVSTAAWWLAIAFGRSRRLAAQSISDRVPSASEVNSLSDRLPKVRSEDIRIVVLARPAPELCHSSRQRPWRKIVLRDGCVPPRRVTLADDDAARRGEAGAIGHALHAVARLVEYIAARLRDPEHTEEARAQR